MLSLLAEKNRSEIIAQLRAQVGRLETAAAQEGQDHLRFTSGSAELDRLLPAGGVRRGTLLEWLAPSTGSGAGTLALLVAREACRAGGALVVVDRRGEFYPPAAARWGIDLGRTLFVRPAREADDHWVFDQALRCRGVKAVLGWPERLDDRTFRRWQLAALAGGSLGLLLRPDAVAASPSWAEVRLLVQPTMQASAWGGGWLGRKQRDAPAAAGWIAGDRAPIPLGLPVGQPQPPDVRNLVGVGNTGRRIRVELLRCRGGADGGCVELEIDDETGVVRLAAELAPATAVRRAAGA